MAPPALYAAEFRIRGMFCESQVSPCFTGLRVGLQLSCMSLHRLGVMKLYLDTLLLARSEANSVKGRTWLMHSAEFGFSVLVTSSKYTNGLCFTAYLPLLVRGHVVR